jgi:hypothetical protein
VFRSEVEQRLMELTGDDASVEIGLRLLAGEHEWGLGKWIRGSVEANGGQRRLPTVVRGLSERRSRGDGFKDRDVHNEERKEAIATSRISWSG